MYTMTTIHTNIIVSGKKSYVTYNNTKGYRLLFIYLEHNYYL